MEIRDQTSSDASSGADSDRCNLCGSSDFKPLFMISTYRHVRCSGCGLVFVHPRPDDTVERNVRIYGRDNEAYAHVPRQLASASVEEVRASIRPTRRHTAQLRRFEPYRKAGRLLDVGCSYGRFLVAAQAVGWDACGVELAPETYEAATALGFDVWNGTIETAPFEPHSFDAVRINQVIEHVPDPMSFVRAASALVRPGGLMMLATINFESWSEAFLGPRWRHLGTEANGHIYFFSPATLASYMEQCGMRPIRTETAGVRIVSQKPPTKFMRRVVKLVERLLNQIAQLVGRGGRITVWAEAVDST